MSIQHPFFDRKIIGIEHNWTSEKRTCTKCGETFNTSITDSCNICFECMYPVKG